MSEANLYDAQLERGSLLSEHGRYEEAVELFAAAISDNPHNPAAYIQKALCEIHLEDRLPAAVASIEEGIRLDLNDGFSQAVHAMVLVQLDRPKHALEAAEEALKLDPSEPFHMSVKGQALAGLKQWDRAENWLRKAIAEDPDDDEATGTLTHVLRMGGKGEESEFEVQRLLTKNPNSELAHFNAGYSCLERGNREQAEKHFIETLKIAPNFEEVREGLIESFRARSAFCRAYLKYSLFMQKFSAGTRLALIIYRTRCHCGCR